MKIVSLLPSATEIVYALGLQDSLEGVSCECDFPDDARNKRVISLTSAPPARRTSQREIDRAVKEKLARGEPLYSLDEGAVRSIQPDLILAQDLCRVCAVPSGQVTDALDKIGCRSEVVSLDPRALEDIFEGIEEVGDAAWRAGTASALTRSLRERVERVRARASARPRQRTCALEWLDPPFVGGHWIPEMVDLAGGVDVLGRPGAPSRAADWSELAEAGPDVVVYMPCGYGLSEAVAQGRSLYSVPELSRTRAAATGRVYATDASSYFSRPGPRIVDGLEALAWALHPDVFPEPGAGRIELVVP